MKQTLISSLFGLASLFSTGLVYAGTQHIIASATGFNVSPGDAIEFSVDYAAGSPEATGVSFKLHFDSSKLEFVGIENILETELTLVSPAVLDVSDIDQDSETDKMVVIAFGEVIGDFIESSELPEQLLTAKFKATSAFTSDTAINFTGIAGGNHLVSFTPVNIILADIVAPTFTSDPTTMIVEASAALTPVSLEFPAATDERDGDIVAVADNEGPFAVGTHAITWTATDSANNSVAVEQTVIVQDTTPPSLTAAADIQKEATGDVTVVSLGTVIANDLVDGEITAVASSTGPFAVGTHIVTWTATDAANNVATAEQKVIITAVTPTPETKSDSGGGSTSLLLLPLLFLLGVGKRFGRLKVISISCAMSFAMLTATLSIKPIAANELLFGTSLVARDGQYLPSLSINIEEPQPESDSVGGHPLPFIDVHRAARPYKGNYTCDDLSFDAYGWVAEIPDTCADGIDEWKQSATTGALRFIQHGSVPEGVYTVLYEGTGTLKFSGLARYLGETEVTTINPDVKALQINVTIEDKSASDQIAGLRYQILETDISDPIRNIRIVIPGSACLSDDGFWLTEEIDCTDKVTKPFAEILADDRNAILFNPDYLRELKPYKSIRMMNMIKASPAFPYIECPSKNQDCVYMPLEWDMRAKMDDAVWGASAQTPLTGRYGRGAPPEVLIALANVLQADPWFTIPHSATDEYVTEFAQLVKATLSPGLKPYIEYSNETWNDRFWATTYVRQKGIEERLSLTREDGSVIGCPSGDVSDTASCNQFWAGAFYTAKRSKEIFILWEDIWQEDRAFVRVLSGYTPNEYQTFHMLNYEDTADYVDVFAVAPYFEACRDREAHSEGDCKDTSTIPLTINELAVSGLDIDSMVNKLFEMTNNPNDRYGLDAMISYIAKQKEMVSKFNVRLYSYEGGQHFTVPSTNIAKDEIQLTADQIKGVRAAMVKANKDPRMKTAYLKLLAGWKDAGAEEFTLYTMPQGYHEWGSFGIKSGLNAPLGESPKYDAVITFQNDQGLPWFADVTLRKEQCSLDIDDNGAFHAFTDGLLLKRYLSGFKGELLIEDAVANDAARAEAADIEQYLEACKVIFDIDGNGYTDDDDSMLALRYLLDFRGDTLLVGVTDSNSHRKIAAEVEGYLLKLID